MIGLNSGSNWNPLLTQVKSSLFSVNSYYKTVKEKISISRQAISEYLNFIQETEYFNFIPLFSYSLKVQKANPRVNSGDARFRKKRRSYQIRAFMEMAPFE